MKNLYFILCSICSIFGFSQSDELQGSWYLKTVYLDNVAYERPESVESISATYFSTSGSPTMFAEICETGGIIGNFNFNEPENEIIFNSLSFFQGNCSEDECIEFQNVFFSFFELQLDAVLVYDLITINDDSQTLKLLDSNGNYVEYTNHLRYPPQEISENNWYLESMKMDGVSYTAPQNEEIPNIQLNFNDNNLESGACNGVVGGLTDFYIDESVIYLHSPTYTDDWCENNENENFRMKYYQFFLTNYSEQFTYQITNNSNGSKKLQIASFNGDFVIYNNNIMVVSENLKKEISIYPNPVSNKLYIENHNSKINEIKITDISGKLLLRTNVNSTKIEIDFKNFPNGIYFLTAESKGKTIRTEKIIKI